MRLSNRIIKIINKLCEEMHSFKEGDERIVFFSSLLKELYPTLNKTIRYERGVEYYIREHGSEGVGDVFWKEQELMLHLIDFKPSADYSFDVFLEQNPDYFEHYNKITCENELKELHKYFFIIYKIEQELEDKYKISLK